jgi:hypothetical protein
MRSSEYGGMTGRWLQGKCAATVARQVGSNAACKPVNSINPSTRKRDKTFFSSARAIKVSALVHARQSCEVD